MRRGIVAGVAGVLLTTVLSVVAQPPAASPVRPAPQPPASAAATGAAALAEKPLAGRVVVLDPGHQLGNARFPRQTNRMVPAGGMRKPCNTTGTATNGGYAEATFNWQVTVLVARRLRELGARVDLTRSTNSRQRWGPCVDARGRAGNGTADLKLSIHADGTTARGARGFHVIAPPNRRPWTHDIWRESRAFALTTRAALRAARIPVADYTAGGDGLDVRRDLGTLNLSNAPVVMVELGNMRGRADARRMTRPAGRATYARALVRAVVEQLRA